MEFILIHKPIGPLPPEALKTGLEFLKTLLASPSSVVPGGKIIAAYNARAQWLQVCIWEAPSAEALMPFLETMRGAGFDTQVIPAEKVEAAIPKWEKDLAQRL